MYIAHIREDGIVQTCCEHCRNTASTASFLLNDVGLSNTGYLAGLLHDMGKFTREFLNYITTVSSGEDYNGPKVIHTFSGVSYLLKKFHEGDDYEKMASEVIALAVGSHHGLFDIYKEAEASNAFLYRIEKQPEYDNRAADNFFAECATENEVVEVFAKSVDEIRSLYTSFVNSRNGEDKAKFQKTIYFYLAVLARLILSAVVEGDRRDTASFMLGKDYSLGKSPEWNSEIDRFNTYVSRFSSESPIQKARQQFSDACCDFAVENEDIYRLDLPTGGGKTLSSLRYGLNHSRIHGKKRIFYVAPLLTILEQNAEVIKSAVGEDGVLLHYSNVVDDIAGEDELDRRELLQESWESRIIITTLVQMLQTMFSGKMSSVRRFNALANSVIIFDEIQSLPMKVYSMFNLTVNFLSKFCGTTVILCSATLPSFEKAVYRMDISVKTMISNSLLNETKKIFKRTQIREWSEDVTLSQVPGIVLAQSVNSRSVLVVCNTKKEASYLFNQLKDEKDMRLFHLSAGMCPRHRKDMLAELVEALHNEEKLICISTQVIEAGIDISFSSVFRFAAGIDSVVQSAGRCNRNGTDITPHDVFILKVTDESLKGLNEIQRSKEAIFNLLSQFNADPDDFDNDLSSFAAIDYYYRTLFAGLNAEAQDYPNPVESSSPTLLSYLSYNPQLDRDGVPKQGKKDFYYRQSFDTAGSLFSVFDNSQKTVIVPYNDEAKEIIARLQSDSICADLVLQDKLIKKAKDYSVSIFSFSFDTLAKSGAILEIEELGAFCLKEEYYDDFTGVSNKEVKECGTLMM